MIYRVIIPGDSFFTGDIAKLVRMIKQNGHKVQTIGVRNQARILVVHPEDLHVISTTKPEQYFSIENFLSRKFFNMDGSEEDRKT